MATTEEFKNGGSTSYSTSIEYIKASDIKVEIDGSPLTYTTNTNPTSGQYKVVNTTVTLGAAAAGGSGNVHIFRETDLDTPAAVFAAGSSIRAAELNACHDLVRFASQEQHQLQKTPDIKDQAVTSAKIKDATIVDADISGSAAIAHSKIATGLLPSGITVNSANIVNGSIVNDDVNASANIDGDKLANDSVSLAKLEGGALPTDITVASANLVDGTITNADVNGSAAIAGTKVTPAFGSQNVSTSGTLASGAQTVTGNIAVSGTVDGRDVAADGTKLDGIESGATADQTNAEIKTAYEANSNTNEFSDAEQTKLAGIETAATADQTAAEIKTLLAADKITDAHITTGTLDNRYYTETELNAGQLDNRYYTEAELNGGQLNTLYFTEAEITGGAADGRYYTETELNNGQLDNRYFTETELTGGALDGRYYTETEAEALFLRQDSSETIASGTTWSNADNKVATTAAINARIIDLIDDVGGFTVIANENSFPNTNPQGTAGQSAILSIGAVTTALTPSSGTVTLANGRLNNGQVLITGVTSTIPQGFGLLVESTSTDHTYAFHRLVPKATEVTTVASNITNIVAAGANVADINNFADLYQISNNAPTQRVDGTSLQDGDLWFDNSNDNLRVYDGSNWAVVTPAQSVLDNIAIVSGAITYSEDLGLIGDPVTTGSSNGSLDIVADILEDEATFTVTASGGAYFIDGVSKPALTLYKGWTYTFDLSSNTLGSHPLRFYAGSSQYSTNVTVTGTQGQAGAKVSIKIPETQPTNFQYYCTNHSGMGNTITVKDDPIKTVSDNVTNIIAVANNSTNINAVNSNSSNINSAVSNASNINSAVSNASNINSVVSNATNINTVAGSISNVNSVGNNISNVNSVHSNATNINSAVSNASNINTVAGSISNVNTVGNNISNVNNFANRYRIASSAPSSNNDEGDLYFDTTSNELRVYNGSAWQGGVTATGNLAGLGANTFSGNISFTGSQTVDGRDVSADGSKLDGIESGATADQTASEIASLISGQTIAPNVITTTNLTLDFGSIA